MASKAIRSGDGQVSRKKNARSAEPTGRESLGRGCLKGTEMYEDRAKIVQVQKSSADLHIPQ
jgi:hypothetical protein